MVAEFRSTWAQIKTTISKDKEDKVLKGDSCVSGRQADVILRMVFILEPPGFVSQAKLYSTYRKDLKMMSRIRDEEKKLAQACA